MERLPVYDESCYLCPGNARAGGQLKNDNYRSTFVSFPKVILAVSDAEQGYGTHFPISDIGLRE